MSRIDEAFAQGARCGHICGRDRCGSYVLGEEYEVAYDVEYEGNTEYRDSAERVAWREGYRRGYCLGAEGEPLPVEYQYPVERKPRAWA